MKIKNISVKDFLSSKEAVSLDNILKNIVGANLFCGNKLNLNKVSYKDVRDVEALLTKGKTFGHICKAFSLSFLVTEEQFFESGIVEYYTARNYLTEAIKKIRADESRLLKSINVHADLWDSAGGERLSKYGNLMPLVKLGKIYGVFPYELQSRPYNEILTLLVLHKDEEEVGSKYNELVKERLKK